MSVVEDIEWLSKLLMPESVQEGECSWQSDEDEEVTDIEVRGWKLKALADEIGRNGRLLSDSTWAKGDHTIYLVNESPYQSGGDFQISIVADTKEEIEAFVKDFSDVMDNPRYPTEGPAAAVQQTM